MIFQCSKLQPVHARTYLPRDYKPDAFEFNFDFPDALFRYSITQPYGFCQSVDPGPSFLFGFCTEHHLQKKAEGQLILCSNPSLAADWANTEGKGEVEDEQQVLIQ